MPFFQHNNTVKFKDCFKFSETLYINVATCLNFGLNSELFTYRYKLIKVNGQDQKLVKTDNSDLLC